MLLRVYSNCFLMLRYHTGMVVPRAFHSCWKLLAFDQIQLDTYCTVVWRQFEATFKLLPEIPIFERIPNYIWFYLYHHHLATLLARNSTTLSCYSSLSSIASGWSSSLHPVCVQSYCRKVLVSRPTHFSWNVTLWDEINVSVALPAMSKVGTLTNTKGLVLDTKIYYRYCFLL